jgi:signal peptidase II
MKGNWIITSSLALGIFAADQAVKLLVMDHIELFGRTTVIPGFLDLVHTVNRGAAFGFLNTTAIDWQVPLFIGATIIALGVIIWLLATTRKRDYITATSLGLIAGGALGNLLDRLLYGHVVDYLYFHINEYYWPAFNLADSAITVGAATLVVSMFLKARHASDTP